MSATTEPTKLCECGCGQPTAIAKKTAGAYGHIKGQPLRFVHGHNGATRSAEAQARVSAALSRRTGEANPGWRGGVVMDRGRRRLKVGKTHPMADCYGYCAEHRLILAACLGRFLRREELVHHIDCDFTNNEPANLLLVSRSEHVKIHNRIRRGMDPLDAVVEVLA